MDRAGLGALPCIMRKRAAQTFVIVLALLLGGSRLDAQASGFPDLVARCQVNARSVITSVRAAVDSIWFYEAPRVGGALNDAAQVVGVGIVHDLVTRQWRRFTYNCAWKVGTFQAGFAVNIDSAAVRR